MNPNIIPKGKTYIRKIKKVTELHTNILHIIIFNHITNISRLFYGMESFIAFICFSTFTQIKNIILRESNDDKLNFR